MRWVFIRPTNHSPYYDPEVQEPLGIETLGASRQALGDAVLILDGALAAGNDLKLARRAASFQPDIVGLSIVTAQELASVTAILAEIRRQRAGQMPRFLAGGNFVSTEPAAAAASLPEEVRLVRFEGETVLAQLASDDGRLPRMVDGAPVADLDTLPFALRPFARQLIASGWPFSIQGSRGCCGACKYCSSPGMSRLPGNPWRGRSPEHVVAEIDELHRHYGAVAFNLVDDDFLGPPRLAEERARRFAEGLARHRLPVTFSLQLRPHALTLEIIDRLAAAGLCYAFVGLESDDPADLRRWGRPPHADPWPLIDRLQHRGVACNVGSLLFHPDATFASLRRFARRLHDHRLLNYRSAMNRMDAMPGSVYHRQLLAEGRADPAVPGPVRLPFHDTRIDACHQDVLAALAPLGPVSMQAVCALPALLSKQRFQPGATPVLDRLNALSARLDDAVAESFFAVLDWHEKPHREPGLTAALRRRNFALSDDAARELAALGLVDTADRLRQATRVDAGAE